MNLDEWIILVRSQMKMDNWRKAPEPKQTQCLLLTIRDIVGKDNAKRYQFLSALLGEPIISQKQVCFTKFTVGRLITLLKENHDTATTLHVELERRLQSGSLARAQDFYGGVQETSAYMSDMLDFASQFGGVPSSRMAHNQTESTEQPPA